MPKVDVSFKKTSKDMRLYSEVKSKEEQSEFIKECIQHWIDTNKNKK